MIGRWDAGNGKGVDTSSGMSGTSPAGVGRVGGTERGDGLAVGPAWTQNQAEANGAGTVTGHLSG